MAEAPTGRGRRRLLKIGVALVVLAGLGFLFVRSARDARSTPYTVAGAHLGRWTLALEPAAGPAEPMLVLRPPSELAGGLFNQVFTRAMESLSSPPVTAMPLLLQGEFDRAFAGRVTPEALLAAGRNAGLDAAPFQPRCLGYRRLSEPGSTRQLYFLLFDAPAFGRFRQQMGALLGGGEAPRGDFDPEALSPVLLIATAGPVFNGWLPLRADPTSDCIAPIAKS